MSDFVSITPGSGANVAVDDIDGLKYQRIKLITGNDGVNDGDVSDSNPLAIYNQRGDSLLEMLSRLVKILESNATVDSAQRQRITLDSITAGVTLPTVSAVTTVTTVTTVSALTNMVSNAGMDREQYINIAKQTYAQSIRSNLTFT